jgi:hypothetical protein
MENSKLIFEKILSQRKIKEKTDYGGFRSISIFFLRDNLFKSFMLISVFSSDTLYLLGPAK